MPNAIEFTRIAEAQPDLSKLADDVIAQVLEQVVANDPDDGIEERHVLDHIGGIVTPLQEGVDACCEIVGQVIVHHALEQAQHVVLDAELILDDRIAQLDKELVELLGLFDQTLTHLDGLDLLHRQVILSQHRAAVAHALDVDGAVTRHIGLTFKPLVLEFDTATASDLLGTFVLDLDFEILAVLLAIYLLDNRLGEHVNAAQRAQDVQYLAARAREVNLLGHLIATLLHRLGDVVDDGGVEVHEDEPALAVVAQQGIVAVQVAVDLAQGAQFLYILNREQEGVDVLAALLCHDVGKDAAQVGDVVALVVLDELPEVAGVVLQQRVVVGILVGETVAEDGIARKTER